MTKNHVENFFVLYEKNAPVVYDDIVIKCNS